MSLKGHEEIVWNWQKRLIRPREELLEEFEYLKNVEAISHPEILNSLKEENCLFPMRSFD